MHPITVFTRYPMKATIIILRATSQPSTTIIMQLHILTCHWYDFCDHESRATSHRRIETFHIDVSPPPLKQFIVRLNLSLLVNDVGSKGYIGEYSITLSTNHFSVSIVYIRGLHCMIVRFWYGIYRTVEGYPHMNAVIRKKERKRKGLLD